MQAINLLNNSDKLEINGNTSISSTGSYNYKNAWITCVQIYTGEFVNNGNFAINKLEYENTNTTDNDGITYVMGVYSTTNDETDYLPTGLTSTMILGQDNNDKVNINNIDVKANAGEVLVSGATSQGENSNVAFLKSRNQNLPSPLSPFILLVWIRL